MTNVAYLFSNYFYRSVYGKLSLADAVVVRGTEGASGKLPLLLKGLKNRGVVLLSQSDVEGEAIRQEVVVWGPGGFQEKNTSPR